MTELHAFDAVLFDMDGTLTNNTPIHQDSFVRLGTRYQLRAPTPEVAASLSGMRNSEIMPVLFGRELSAEEIERYSTEKELIYRSLIADSLVPVRGLLSLLAVLDAQAIPCALATSAPTDNVALTLQALGIAGRFAALVLGGEVPRSKPAPDIFLEAARRLARAPERCLVFEDAFAGVKAAKAAGMQCVALATTHTVEELRANTEADMIVRDYGEFLELFPTLPPAS